MAIRADPVPRAGLSRERVLRAAIELADASGIEALTMRKLADALGVEAMTLYHYVRNKEELVNAIVDLVVGEFELPAAVGDWRAAMRASAVSAYRALLRHRWASGRIMSSGPGPARKRHMDAILGCLRRAGFSAEMTDHAYHALDSHIVGFTLWQAGVTPPAGTRIADVGRAFLRELSPDEHPYLIEHVHQHLSPSGKRDKSEFEFGLDLLLDGLERLRRARPTRPGP